MDRMPLSPAENEAARTIEIVRSVTKELTKSKATARAFLIKHGYITKSGKLTKRYGG